MSPPSMLPVSGEQHEKAIEAGATALATTGVWRTDSEEAEATIAAYFASLAAQGVRLVDRARFVREVAEWLRELDASGAVANYRDDQFTQTFLARFGDEHG